MPQNQAPETLPRHGHFVTPGSAEGERSVVEEALRRQGGRRPSDVRTAGNRKRAA